MGQHYTRIKKDWKVDNHIQYVLHVEHYSFKTKGGQWKNANIELDNTEISTLYQHANLPDRLSLKWSHKSVVNWRRNVTFQLGDIFKPLSTKRVNRLETYLEIKILNIFQSYWMICHSNRDVKRRLSEIGIRVLLRRWKLVFLWTETL